jgi:transcriptional regulator with XRE-family HTH domain
MRKTVEDVSQEKKECNKIDNNPVLGRLNICGKVIRALRESLGWSRVDLSCQVFNSSCCDLSVDTIAAIEDDCGGGPDNFALISKALGINWADFNSVVNCAEGALVYESFDDAMQLVVREYRKRVRPDTPAAASQRQLSRLEEACPKQESLWPDPERLPYGPLTRALRKAAGLSRNQMAAAASERGIYLSVPRLVAIETQQCRCSLEMLKGIAAVFDLSTAEFMTLTDLVVTKATNGASMETALSDVVKVAAASPQPAREGVLTELPPTEYQFSKGRRCLLMEVREGFLFIYNRRIYLRVNMYIHSCAVNAIMLGTGEREHISETVFVEVLERFSPKLFLWRYLNGFHRNCFCGGT